MYQKDISGGLAGLFFKFEKYTSLTALFITHVYCGYSFMQLQFL